MNRNDVTTIHATQRGGNLIQGIKERIRITSFIIAQANIEGAS